jgi:hypothetical protein
MISPQYQIVEYVVLVSVLITRLRTTLRVCAFCGLARVVRAAVLKSFARCVWINLNRNDLTEFPTAPMLDGWGLWKIGEDFGIKNVTIT